METATEFRAITPSDTEDLDPHTRFLYVGVTGAITVKAFNGDVTLFLAVPVGQLDIQPKRIMATGTTATNIVGCW